MPISNVFDNTFPPDTQQANQLGVDIRTFKLDIQQRLGAISDILANRWNPGADVQPTQWTGVLFFATDTQQVFRWSGAAWVDVSTSFSTVSHLTDLVVHTLSGSGVGSSVVIPANFLQIGSVVDITARVACISYTSGTPNFYLSIGSALFLVTASPVNTAIETFTFNASFSVVSAASEVGYGVWDRQVQSSGLVNKVRQYNGTDPISGAITISTNAGIGGGAVFTGQLDYLAVRIFR